MMQHLNLYIKPQLLNIQNCNFEPFLNGVVYVAAFSSTVRYQDLEKPCQGIPFAPKTTSCLQQLLDMAKQPSHQQELLLSDR